LFAVSCMHCALFYRTLEPANHMFVSVPADVVARTVIGIYFPTMPTPLDVTAVEVPDDATVAAIDWPLSTLTLPRCYGCVVGASHSSIVSGEGAMVDGKASQGNAGVFVEIEGPERRRDARLRPQYGRGCPVGCVLRRGEPSVEAEAARARRATPRPGKHDGVQGGCPAENVAGA
jgi:hypothetical protein